MTDGTDATNQQSERELRLERYDAKYWQARLKEYRDSIESQWCKQRENLDRLYSKEDRADAADREYSIFWANLQVLQPAVYARTPVPVVAPRFKVTNPVASSASEILERCLVTTFEQQDVHSCLIEVRNELLRYGRGSARARLAQNPDGTPFVKFEQFGADDFAHDHARIWDEVKWEGFRAWLTEEEGSQRFDEALTAKGKRFAEVPKKKRDPNAINADKMMDKVPVWEIWCKTTGMVHWVNEDFPVELDVQKPWIDLSSFWPSPKPAFGTCVPKKLKPVPDIVQYKDQIEEINEYTARIAALSESLKLKGFYPAGTGEIGDAIEAAMKATDNRAILVPVSSFAALGGASLKDSIVWMPIVDCLALVKGLVELRRVVIEDVYQITGISDIVRGQTEATETATAQQIKAQWGSLRIRERQNEMARFARDLTRIAGEIIAENFPPQVIAEMAQVPAEEAMQAGPVFEFLQNDRARGFTIEIETDSTIQPDEDADKNRRIEFVTAVGQLFQQAAPIVMQAPQLGPFLGEVLKFTAQGFRAGRPLEATIEQLTQQLGQMAQRAMQPQQPQPDPEMLKHQADVEYKQQDMQLKAASVQADHQNKQAEMQMRADEVAQKAALDREMAQQNIAMQRELGELKLQIERERLELEREKLAIQRDQADCDMECKRSTTISSIDNERKRMEMDDEQQRRSELRSDAEEAAKEAEPKPKELSDHTPALLGIITQLAARKTPSGIKRTKDGMQIIFDEAQS